MDMILWDEYVTVVECVDNMFFSNDNFGGSVIIDVVFDQFDITNGVM